MMSMVNLKYSARVISSDTGWGVFTTAGTTGIHYCWLCLWCPVLLSTAGTGIQYCYPLLVSTAAGLCGGNVVSDQILVEVVDQRFSSDKLPSSF